MTTFGPLHGRPSAYAKHMDLNWEVGRIALASAATLSVHQASPRVLNHVGVTTLERLDQGHLYPLGERHARQTMVTGGARTSAPLHHRRPLYLKTALFGASTWSSSMTTFGPLHGRPSAYAKHMDLNWEVGRIALASAATLNVHQASPRVSNHVGVTTIERLDQGHLYLLGERHAGQTMVTGGARTFAPLHRRRPLYLKSYLDSL
jgi:hypothetical protein